MSTASPASPATTTSSPATPATPAAPAAPAASATPATASTAKELPIGDAGAAGQPEKKADAPAIPAKTPVPQPFVPAKTPPPAAEEPRGRDFAALARKQSEVVKAQLALKEEKAALGKEFEAVKAWEAAKQNARLDPDAALKALGLTYEQVTEYYLSGGKAPADARVKALEDKFEARWKEESTRREQERADAAAALDAGRKQALENFRAEVREYVRANASDATHLTSLAEADSLVAALIEQRYGETGELLNYGEAAAQIEEQVAEFVLKAAATQKIAARLRPPPPPTTASITAPQAQQPPVRTLHNAMTGSTAPTNGAPPTRDERLARAIAAAEAARAARRS